MSVKKANPNRHFYCEKDPALNSCKIMILVARINIDEYCCLNFNQNIYRVPGD